MAKFLVVFLVLLSIFSLGIFGDQRKISFPTKTEGEKATIDCDICLGGALLLDSLIESNISMVDIESILIKFCTFLHIPKVSAAVCEGIIPEFGPGVLPILVHAGLKPHEICSYLGFCPKDTKVKRSKTLPLSLPPKPEITKPKIKEPTSRNVALRVLQISDLHYDEEYLVGSIADCDDPLCCRSFTNGNGTRKASKWGDYSCDLPPLLFQAYIDQIAFVATKVDILVWTGDNTPHDVWNETIELQLNRLKYISSVISQKIGTKVPVFPALGNHDSFPCDQFNRLPKDDAHYDDFDWLLSAMSEYWSPFLDSQALQTFRTGGYYTKLAKPGLRVVALDTQFGDIINFYLLLQENQHREQFNWLIDVLTNAEKNGEKVIIIGHIPSGLSVPSDYSSYADDYVAIVNRFSDIIIGQFFGHTHWDQFEMVYQNGTIPSGVIYIAPSATTFTNHNPSYRIYEYDENFNMLDYKQYYLNLSRVIETDNATFWELEYSARDEYGMNDLSPLSWHEVIHSFEENDELFQRWYHNSGTRTSNAECGILCKIENICQLKSATVTQALECAVFH